MLFVCTLMCAERSPNIPELGPKLWSKFGKKARVSASNCQLQAEIWGVTIFLNYIATSKVDPML